MKITRVQAWRSHVRLSRPYSIAYKTTSAVDLHYLVLESDGSRGIGAASPAPSVTGETADRCQAALEGLEDLVGEDPRRAGRLTRRLRQRLSATPAACAAVDMALADLLARHLETPLVDFLGRCHTALPTSVTIGIKPVAETLEEALEHLDAGFRCLKIKLGHSFAEDEERLRRLHEEIGHRARVRVDANQGYEAAETRKLGALAEALSIELIEQPMAVDRLDAFLSLPEALRRRVALDESLVSEADAFRLTRPENACGIFNIKLMKCGGPSAALGIARIADAAGIDLMWGCMDESVASIAGALHVAYACPATRYIDLDGSFDLTDDEARGGFRLDEAGRLHTLDEPGTGVRIDV